MSDNHYFNNALHELEHYDIKHHEVYLIDLIPLIEMIWADDVKQESEIAILLDFAKQHMHRINQMAGCEILSDAQTKQFLRRFLEKRPDPELLKTLRQLITPARFSSSDETNNEKLKASILSACLNIAASATTSYPYGLTDRFNEEERRCFFEILQDFDQQTP